MGWTQRRQRLSPPPDHPAKRYVVRGRMHSCEEFILALRAGFMHNETWGTLATITASDLGIGAGDDFEFVLGDGGHEIPDGAIMASVREYYFDWTAEEPATFTIECLDPEPVELPPLDDRLHAAVDQVSDSLRYWADYLASNRPSGSTIPSHRRWLSLRRG